LPDVANTVLFRLAQEALTNIERHAGASSINITLAGEADGVTLRIRDDGHGFDAEASPCIPSAASDCAI
jgi:two-component system NarL family sensor kinase